MTLSFIYLYIVFKKGKSGTILFIGCNKTFSLFKLASFPMKVTNIVWFQEAKDPLEKAVLDGRQLALKVNLLNHVNFSYLYQLVLFIFLCLAHQLLIWLLIFKLVAHSLIHLMSSGFRLVQILYMGLRELPLVNYHVWKYLQVLRAMVLYF